jgi:hypothetical protein
VAHCSLLEAPRTGGRVIAPELKRKALLREVNTRIREMNDRFGTTDGSYRLLCECGRVDCEERLEVPVADYDDLRRRSGFLVAPAHEPQGAAGQRVVLMPGLVPADPLHLQ